MSESQHSPEPWRVGGEIKTLPTNWNILPTAQDANGVPRLCAYPNDLERIVACVNACAGIPTEVLTARDPGGDFNTVLATLAQHAVLTGDSRMGCEQTGYVLGDFIARHWKNP